MFVRDPFDIAPKAARHTNASWLLLVLGVLFAVLCAFLLDKNLRAMKRAEEISKIKVLALRTLAESDAAAKRRQADPLALEKMRAQQKLQDILRMSWSGLFDALEVAGREVGGRATVVSLAPVKTQADAAEVNVSALAISNEVMVDYLRALGRNPHLREVQLTAQQPAVSGAAPVVQFQVSILWKPQSVEGLR